MLEIDPREDETGIHSKATMENANHLVELLNDKWVIEMYCETDMIQCRANLELARQDRSSSCDASRGPNRHRQSQSRTP